MVNGLAGNTSLKLYLAELEQSDSGQGDASFASFLSHLLISEAQQHGFHEVNSASSVPANLSTEVGAGLAIVDKNGVPMVATQGMPTLAQLPRVIAKEFRANGVFAHWPFLTQW